MMNKGITKWNKMFHWELGSERNYARDLRDYREVSGESKAIQDSQGIEWAFQSLVILGGA
jgi:hypothetical protein